MEPCLSRHARKGGAGDPFIVESLQWESSCRVFPPSCLVILITFLLYCSAPSSPRGGTRSSTSGISSLDNRIFSEIVSFSFFFSSSTISSKGEKYYRCAIKFLLPFFYHLLSSNQFLPSFFKENRNKRSERFQSYATISREASFTFYIPV